jgi:glycosyltransferase involved in cell wall biosynthesis
MKLIFTNRFFYPDHSATSQLLSDLAFHLAKQGRDVHVVTSRQRYDDPGAILPASEITNDDHIHRVWTSRFGRTRLLGRALDYLTFYTRAAWRLWRLARRDDVIVAKTDPPLISVVGAAVARLRGARLINWLQDVFPEVAAKLGVRMMQSGLGHVVQRLRNASLKSATRNVALGWRMAGHLQEQGIASERITIIHNWAEEKIRPVAPEENLLRTEWELAGKFVVGYSGNMGRAHEFTTILQAMEWLQEKGGEGEYKHIVFLFIGGGHYRPWLEQQVKRRGLNRIVFKSYQPREILSESLNVLDVHLISLLPSMEGLIVPSKFYGIAAAGRPVLFIGDPQGEIGRIIREADCGATINVGEGKMLGERIMKLYRSQELRRRWGRNARKLLEERFDREIALAAWSDLLEHIGKHKDIK